jgi:hypothetical protein
MRALLALLLVACSGDNITRTGDESAESCCWLWPNTDAIKQCVRDTIEPGCVELSCTLGNVGKVCTEEPLDASM